MRNGSNVINCRVKAEDYQRRWVITTCLIIGLLALSNLSLGLQQLTGIPQTTVSLGCKVVIALSFAACLPTFIYELPRKLILIISVSVLFLIFNFAVFPDNFQFASTAQTYLFTVLPLVSCMVMIHDKGLLVRPLFVTSIVISFGVIAVCVTQGGQAFGEEYSMGFSSSLVLPVNMLLYYLFCKLRTTLHKAICTIVALLDVYVIVAYGSRGALLAILLFFCYLFIKIKPSSSSTLLFRLALIAGAVGIVLSFDAIIDTAYQLSLQMGFNSRTLLLLHSDLTHDSGRDILWRQIIQQLQIDPVAIRGVNADYNLIGIYSHNIFLELSYQFGIPLACIAVAFIGRCIFIDCSKEVSDDTVFGSLLLSGWFPILLWSGSLWTNMFFWPWLLAIPRNGSSASEGRTLNEAD